MTIYLDAHPDEHTVQKVAAESAAGKGLRRRRRSAQRRAVTVRQITVDPRVWSTANRLAEGDMHRLVIHPETEVSVLNPR